MEASTNDNELVKELQRLKSMYTKKSDQHYKTGIQAIKNLSDVTHIETFLKQKKDYYEEISNNMFKKLQRIQKED